MPVSSTTSIPSIVSGLPARPTATTRPSRDRRCSCARTPSTGSSEQPADDRELDAAALGAHAEPVAHRVARSRAGSVRPARLVALGDERTASLSPSRTPGRQAPRYPRSRAQLERRVAARPARPAARRPGRRGRGSRARRRTAPAGRRAARRVRRTPSRRRAIASRMPHAAARSKRSARLTSKKWKCDVTPTGTVALVDDRRARVSLRQPLDARPPARGGPVAPDRVVQHDSRLPSANSASTSTRGTSVGDAVEHVARRRAPRSPRASASAYERAVARGLADLVGDQRDRLGLAEPQPARAPLARQLGGQEQQQPVLLAGQQPHARATLHGRGSLVLSGGAVALPDPHRSGNPHRRSTTPSTREAAPSKPRASRRPCSHDSCRRRR